MRADQCEAEEVRLLCSEARRRQCSGAGRNQLEREGLGSLSEPAHALQENWLCSGRGLRHAALTLAWVIDTQHHHPEVGKRPGRAGQDSVHPEAAAANPLEDDGGRTESTVGFGYDPADRPGGSGDEHGMVAHRRASCVASSQRSAAPTSSDRSRARGWSRQGRDSMMVSSPAMLADSDGGDDSPFRTSPRPPNLRSAPATSTSLALDRIASPTEWPKTAPSDAPAPRLARRPVRSASWKYA